MTVRADYDIIFIVKKFKNYIFFRILYNYEYNLIYKMYLIKYFDERRSGIRKTVNLQKTKERYIHMKKMLFISTIVLSFLLCSCGSNYDSEKDESYYDDSSSYSSYSDDYDSSYDLNDDDDDYKSYGSYGDSYSSGDDDSDGYSYDSDDYYYSSNDKDGNGKLSDEEFQNAVGDYLDDIMGN